MAYWAVGVEKTYYSYYYKVTLVDFSLTTLLTKKSEMEQELDSKLKENVENVDEQTKVAAEFNEAVANNSPNLPSAAQEVLDWAEYIQEQQEGIIALAEQLGNMCSRVRLF